MMAIERLSLSDKPWFGVIPFSHKKGYGEQYAFDPAKLYLSVGHFYLDGPRYAAVQADDLDAALHAFLNARNLQNEDIDVVELAGDVYIVNLQEPELTEVGGYRWTPRIDLFQRQEATVDADHKPAHARSVYTDVLTYYDAKAPWSDHHIAAVLEPSAGAFSGLPNVAVRDLYLGLAELCLHGGGN